MTTLSASRESNALAIGGASAADKGIPFGMEIAAGNAAGMRINVLDEQLHFPLLLLKESALAHNLAAMATWCAANGFWIAPHGKTTMTPRIFTRQIESGAWAMTVATASQAAICAAAGVQRILIANQVVGRANVRSLAAMAKADPALELLCLVDSVEGIEFLSSEWNVAGVGRPIGVLVEIGHRGWRAGVRSLDSALQICAAAASHPHTLTFRGIEGFEGLAHASDFLEEGRIVREFLDEIAGVAEALYHKHDAQSAPMLVSVGGSAFLDEVWELGRRMQGRFQFLIRSGCYVTHDHGVYAERTAGARRRAKPDAHLPEFHPALELWSLVQSKPEEGTVILNFGKRDCPYDSGLPIPLFARRYNAAGVEIDLRQTTVAGTNDQHAYLKGPGIEQLQVGDQVCCGISHPCTAFDKWRTLPVVDDRYNVLEVYRTYF